MLVTSKPSRVGWTDWHLVGAALMALVGVAATHQAWFDLVNTAIQRGQTQHLILLPLVVVWLAWVRRQRLKLCRAGGTWIGPVIVGGGWLISVLGNQMSLEVIWHLGAVCVVVGCVISVLGIDVLRIFGPAFLALLFVVPLPYRVEWRIMEPVASLSTELVQATVGIGQVSPREAAEAMLCAALLAYAFAFSMPYRNWVRGVVIAVSPIAAVLGLIVQELLHHEALVYSRSPDDLLWDRVSRWLLVPLTLALLLGLVKLLRWAALPLQHYKLAEEA